MHPFFLLCCFFCRSFKFLFQFFYLFFCCLKLVQGIPPFLQFLLSFVCLVGLPVANCLKLPVSFLVVSLTGLVFVGVESWGWFFGLVRLVFLWCQDDTAHDPNGPDDTDRGYGRYGPRASSIYPYLYA